MVAHHCPFCGSITDRPVIFSPTRQRIFNFIFDNPGCTQEDILLAIWPRRPIATNAISVHLSQIRKGLAATQYQMIHVPVPYRGRTGRVIGYKITYKPKAKENGSTILPTILP